MSEQENSQQLVLIRQSLLENIFRSYHELRAKISNLPIDLNLPFLQKGILDIDTGMTVIKEVVTTQKLLLPAPVLEEKKEITPEEKPLI